jgi:DeoR family fructose operon transcriptional repressor
LHPETQAFAGPITVHALSDLRAHTALLAATSVRDGAMWCTNTFDSATKRALIAAADRVVLLVDSSKFSITAAMKVTELGAVHTVITDDGIEPASRAMCEAAGAEVVLVPAARDQT